MSTKICSARQAAFFAVLLVAFVFCNLQETTAQAPDWAWAKSAGGTQGEFAYSVAADPSGSGYSYVAGYFESDSVTFGSTTLTNVGDINLFIVKYDAAGNVLWAKSAEGSNVNTDKAVAVTTDAAGSGDIYVAGFFSSPSITFGATTLINAGNFDLFIVKYDADGNVLWAKGAGGGYTEFPNSVTTDASGNIFMSGVFGSTSITFGSTTLNNTVNTGSYDVFIVKYDANGNVLWAKSGGGNTHDEAESVTADANGNSYVAGRFLSASITFGITTLTNPGGYDMFIVKYDAAGNVLWAKNAGGSDNDYAFSVAADLLGNSYVTGFFYSPTITFGSTTLTNAGSYDMYIVKYDASGNVLWAKNPGGHYIVAQSIAADPAGSGGCYVTGYFADSSITFGATTLTNSAFDTSSDIFLVKYDESGNLVWAKNPIGINPDQAFSVAADAYGNVYVAGYFSSPSFAFDSTTLTLVSFYDMFVAKIGDTTAASPISAFLSDTVLCEKFCIGFTDQSLNNPVSWQWIFEGGSPSSSSDQNPTNICYDDPGTFDVTLITTNANGISDTLSLNNYITVNPNPFAPTITQSGNTLISSSATSYQWYLNGNMIPGATDQNYTISQAGLFTVEVTNENGCKSQSSIKAYLVGIESLNSDDGIFIYPNPSDGNFVMDWQHEIITGNLEVDIVNGLGQQVFSYEEKISSLSFKKEMNLSHLAQGIYLIEVKTDTLLLKKKIMIIR